jgi:hypothetical protein
MHIVEIRRRGGTLAGPMAAMRTWLDVHRVEPKLFQFSIISAGVIFSLQFQNGGDACGLTANVRLWFASRRKTPRRPICAPPVRLSLLDGSL